MPAAVIAAGSFLSIGCGHYEPEPEYPQQYVAPAPPSAAELASQQEAREQANAESREVLIGADEDEYSDTDPSALTEFKPALDDHGEWVTDSTYGTVWVPSQEEVGADFQPYVTAGHWTYSEEADYVWVSDYSWGWAPFHYGRWVFLPGHGWAWIPGRRYAGAWVTWRVGPDGYGYVGWAPAPPGWYWYHGAAYGWNFGWYDYHHYYVYCPRDRVYYGGVGTYVVRGPAARNGEYWGRTHDYVPSPRGGGSGDRVVANPSVNGGGSGSGGRVVANPSVGSGHINPAVASPNVTQPPKKVGLSGNRGPRPDELGVKNDAVVAPPTSHEGLARAQAFASPSTAVPAGAAAPSHLRPASDNAFGSERSRGPASTSSVPYSGSARPSSSFGSQPGFAGAAPRSEPSHPSSSFGSSPPASAYRSSPSTSSSPPSSSYRSSVPAVRSTPSYNPSSSYHSSAPTPSYHSAPPSVHTPSASPPAFHPSAPSMHSSSTPSFHSAAPAPSHSSAPSRSSGSARSGKKR